ncbi:MAG: DoxX family protein [Planctomycetes bacterium]|nr:DoxX family protein [Planctomycetota bacterium]
MNITLWVLQGLGALLYAASGVMKVFMFDSISHDVPSFGALPKRVWVALGCVELVCTLGLIVPPILNWQPGLMIVAAAVLALESLVFIGVHVRYREAGAIVMCSVLGLLMAFLAFGRLLLHPFAS